jgi:hypothetical protein
MNYNETDFLADLWEGYVDENDSVIVWSDEVECSEDAALEGSLFGWEA